MRKMKEAVKSLFKALVELKEQELKSKGLIK